MAFGPFQDIIIFRADRRPGGHQPSSGPEYDLRSALMMAGPGLVPDGKTQPARDLTWS